MLPVPHVPTAAPHVAAGNGTNGRHPPVIARAKSKPPAAKTARHSTRQKLAAGSLLARIEVTAGESLSLELFAGSHSIISGEWQPRVVIDGEARSQKSLWEELCVLRTDDADYWEFEMCLGEPWCVQRQIMFARDAQFLLIADKVLGPESAAIEYTCDVPLSPGVAWEPAAESREGWLAGRRKLGVVLPLALPEWRSDHQPGELESVPDGLQLRQGARGRALYAPLLIDLNPRHFRKPYTWRRLTVAEQMQILPRDVAAGFRVQFGREHWLVYRALTTKGNRTVLGKNLCSDFFIGKMKADGKFEQLVEIE